VTRQQLVEMAFERGMDFAIFVAGALAKGSWANRTRLWNTVLCSGPFRRKSVRISAAYLIRIEFEGKHLLVRGGRIRDQFQPVGGVYKYMPHAHSKLEDLGVKPDKSFAIDEDSKNDLRIRVPGKNVAKVLRWFDESRDRECNPWREFFEELVAPGLLSHAVFPHAQFRYVKRDERRVRWTEELKTYEILVFDVFELVPTPEQEAELRRLMAAPGLDHVFAAEGRLRQRGFQPNAEPSERIAPTAEWML
jgi:hypothetical protein